MKIALGIRGTAEGRLAGEAVDHTELLAHDHPCRSLSRLLYIEAAVRERKRRVLLAQDPTVG